MKKQTTKMPKGPQVIFSMGDHARPFTIRNGSEAIHLTMRDARTVRRLLSRLLFQCSEEGD